MIERVGKNHFFGDDIFNGRHKFRATVATNKATILSIPISLIKPIFG